MYKRTKIETEVHPRFLCLEEFMNYTGLGRGSAMKLGKEIGSIMYYIKLMRQPVKQVKVLMMPGTC